ncbi:MAG: hypothetical protein AAF798_09770, partial [Bacteroidota bacterium]
REYSFNREADRNAHTEEFEEYFYETAGYYLFGTFDLAVIAFVDDFKLGSKTFHPYSYLSEEALRDSEDRPLEPENFIFQTTTGFTPAHSNDKKGSIGLFEKARDTFLKSKSEGKRFPLIGICELKLNNGLHIGSGNAMIQLAAQMIETKLEASPKHGAHFEFILLQTYSWNEFVLLIFSDSYKTITEQVLDIREMTFGQLQVFDDKSANYFEQVRENCLLRRMIMHKEADPALIHNAHVFVYSHTTFGFDIELMPMVIQDGKAQIPAHFKPIEDHSLSINMLLSVKPGHLKTVAKELKQRGIDWRVHVGSGDLLLPISENDVHFTYEKVLSQNDLKHLSRHLRSVQTIPELKFEVEELSGTAVEEHFFYSRELHQFAYSLQHIKELRSLLLRCKIGKTLRERIINMYVNYNSGVRDPLLFTYFVELQSFLNKTLFDIARLAERPKQAVEASSMYLESATSDYEKAFRNRFYLSYLMNRVTDYNMEHNGGIQQLVSIFDGVYKMVSEILLVPYSQRPSLCVSSIPRIDVNENFVELSYAHLLQPSIFLSIITATASKHFFKFVEPSSEEDLEALHHKMLIVQNLPLIEEMAFLEDLSDLFGDLVNYYVTYNKDSELFLFWYWHHFLQNPDMYTNEGSIDEELFVKYLLRLMLLFEFLDRNPRFFGTRIVAPVPELQDLWFRWFPRTRGKFRTLIDSEGAEALEDWFTLAKKVIKEVLVVNNYVGINQSEETQNIQFVKILQRKGVEIIPDTRADLLNELVRVRQDDLSFLSDTIMALLEKGKVYFPDKVGDRPLAFYTQAVILGYLKLLSKQFGPNLSVLYRLDTSGHPADFLEANESFTRKYADYTFDPSGGIFLTSIEARRAYFRYRIALYHTLNGLAAKAKEQLFGINE